MFKKTILHGIAKFSAEPEYLVKKDELHDQLSLINAFKKDNGYRMSCPHCTLDVDIKYGKPIPGVWKFPYHTSDGGMCEGSYINLGRAVVSCFKCKRYVDSSIKYWSNEGGIASLAAHRHCDMKGLPVQFQRRTVDFEYVS